MLASAMLVVSKLRSQNPNEILHPEAPYPVQALELSSAKATCDVHHLSTLFCSATQPFLKQAEREALSIIHLLQCKILLWTKNTPAGFREDIL